MSDKTYEVAYYKLPKVLRDMSSYDHDRYPERDHFGSVGDALAHSHKLSEDYNVYDLLISECSEDGNYLKSWTFHLFRTEHDHYEEDSGV